MPLDTKPSQFVFNRDNKKNKHYSEDTDQNKFYSGKFGTVSLLS